MQILYHWSCSNSLSPLPPDNFLCTKPGCRLTCFTFLYVTRQCRHIPVCDSARKNEILFLTALIVPPVVYLTRLSVIQPTYGQLIGTINCKGCGWSALLRTLSQHMPRKNEPQQGWYSDKKLTSTSAVQ
jgi:hypothetical protein